MPITIEEWRKGRTSATLESRLEEFLFQNKEKAFTLAELANNMYAIKFDNPKEVMESFLSYFNVGEALKGLMKEGKVRSRLVRGSISEDVYYVGV